MIRFRHTGCKSEVISYIGCLPKPFTGESMSGDWRFPNGSKPLTCSYRATACPDCGMIVGIDPENLEPIDDDPIGDEL